jgi:hypothetical protein
MIKPEMLTQNQPDVGGTGLTQITPPHLQPQSAQAPSSGIMQSIIQHYLKYELPAGVVPQYVLPPGPLQTQVAAAPVEETAFQQFTQSPEEQKKIKRDKATNAIESYAPGQQSPIAKETMGLLGDIARGTGHELLHDMGVTHDPTSIQEAFADMAGITARFLSNPQKFLNPIIDKFAQSTPGLSLVAAGNWVRMKEHPSDPHSWDMWLTAGLTGQIVDAATAWHDVATRGSDQDWARAIVGTGTLATVFLPAKGMGRFHGSRQMLNKQFQHLTIDTAPGQTFKTVTGQADYGSRLALAPLADQMAAQPTHFTDVAAQIRSKTGQFAKMDDEAKKWYEKGKAAEKMREAIMEQVRNLSSDVPGMAKEQLDYKTAALKAQAEEQYKNYELPARIYFAEHYGSKLENPADVKAFDHNHTPYGPDERMVDEKIRKGMQGEYNQLYGSLTEWGDHGGWFQGMHPLQLLEKTKAVLAGGGQRAGFLEAQQGVKNIVEHAGLDPHDEASWEKLFGALDDKTKFAALTGPEKLAVRYLRNVFDNIALLNYRHSQTRLPLTHWTPFESRLKTLPGIQPATDPTRTVIDWIRGKKVGYDQVFDHSVNPDGTADLHAAFPDRESKMKSLGDDREPLPISDTVSIMLARFFNNVTLSAMGEALLNRAVVPAQQLRDQLRTVEEIMGGITKEGFQTAKVKESLSQAVGDGRIPPGELPDILPEEVFRNEQEAMDLGYVKIRGEIGQKDWMNHQSAIYANDAIKTRDGVGIGTAFLKDLKNATSREDVENAIGKTMDRVAGTSKSLIMYSPIIHRTNMSVGRMLPFLLANSGAAIPAKLKLTLAKLSDPAMYAQMKAWYRKNGGTTAYRHDLEWELQHQFQEADGSDHGGGLKAPMMGMLGKWHSLQKNALWKPVDDMGVVAALVAKDHFMSKGISEEVADMMAPRWGSDFAGQSNPLYMNQSWRKWRGRIEFAPSWWASKMRMMAAVPLTSAPMRMTNLIARKIPALDPVRLKTLNDLQMREYMRLNRRQQMMGMSMALTTVNQLNQIFAGHPVWENPSGHMLDVCFDKYAQATHPASGKSVCTSLLPGIRQDLEMWDAMGFGHPWGPMHLTADAHFQQAAAWDKVYQAANAVIDGARRTGGKTISPMASATMEGLTGADSYNFLTRSQIRPIDRWVTLLSFLPGGLQAKQVAEQGGASGPLGVAGAFGKAIPQSITGMPSIYETGNERPIDTAPEKYLTYQQQSAQFQQQRRFISQQLMTGSQDFQWWKNQNFQILDKYTQLKADSFGTSSPSGVLSKQRDEIRKKYHLDEPGMSGEMLALRQDAFETEWDHVVSNANEAVKRDYWQTERAQWTDADYLYWYAKHTDRQLQGVIDGHGGAKIRLQKAIVAQASQEGLSTAALDQMRRQMPELYLYIQLMKEMGHMSPLGAVVAAARSPFSHVRFVPTQAEAAARQAATQQGLLNPSDVTIGPTSEQALVGEAKAAAESPEVVASAGTK